MEMTVEREKMKALAVETLKKLDVYAPYIRKFAAKKSTVTMFERFGGYYVDGLSNLQDELLAKIEEVEKRYGALSMQSCTTLLTTAKCTPFSLLASTISKNTASPCWSIRKTHTSNTRSRMYGIKLTIIAASSATSRLHTVVAA